MTAPTMALGHYRLIAALGRGATADVYLAASTPSKFSKLFAIKRPHEYLARDTEFLDMLMDEIRIVARLNHTNLVHAFEVGEENGQYFLVMEYLHGQSLHRILSRGRATLPMQMHLAVLCDVLAGIHYAHELLDHDGMPLAIVHRDVTPRNCFVTYQGEVKVVDFGIAKAVGRSGSTRFGVIKGKVAYMSPEQAKGDVVDRRADLFAVGVMLYEAVTKRRMWQGYSEINILRRLIAGKIPCSPREVDPTLDAELDRICARALAYSPADRYASAEEMQKDIDAYLASHGGRPRSDAIGERVGELFSDVRADTDKIIETQIRALRQESSVELMRAPGVAQFDPSQSPQPEDLVPSDAIDGAPAEVEPAPTSTPPAIEASLDHDEQRRRLISFGLGGVLLSLTLFIVAVLLFGPSSSTSSAASDPDAPHSTQQGPAQPLEQGAAQSQTITVALRATPSEARFSIDNGPWLGNPFAGTFTGDGKAHQIIAAAPGYEPTHRVVTFDNDVSLRLTLARTNDRAQ